MNDRRTCSKCREALPPHCFHADASRPGGLAYVCIECRNRRNRERYTRSQRRVAVALLTELSTRDTDECVIWPKGTCNGYGRVCVDGVTQWTHRVVCEWTHGPMPAPNMHAAHHCGVKLCVNARHIRWATVLENIHDKWKHGTMTKGAAWRERVAS